MNFPSGRTIFVVLEFHLPFLRVLPSILVMAREFSLIDRYFCRPHARKDVLLGIGDDAALLTPPPGQQLAITTDTLVSGIHFFADVNPYDLGHKALAVNLSDLAAMGATPAWALLSLTLPDADDIWLTAFSAGLFALAEAYEVALVGGDTTRGPLSITLQLIGFVPTNGAITRRGAQVGERVYVSGMPGEAALGLAYLQGKLPLAPRCRDHFVNRLQRPTPRLALGQQLRGLATAAIDISDGLLQDLQHVLDKSGVGARIDLNALPQNEFLDEIPLEHRRTAQLYGGDDYELCFTVSRDKSEKILDLSMACGVLVTEIGTIEAALGICDLDGVPLAAQGYQHF